MLLCVSWCRVTWLAAINERFYSNLVLWSRLAGSGCSAEPVQTYSNTDMQGSFWVTWGRLLTLILCKYGDSSRTMLPTACLTGTGCGTLGTKSVLGIWQRQAVTEMHTCRRQDTQSGSPACFSVCFREAPCIQSSPSVCSLFSPFDAWFQFLFKIFFSHCRYDLIKVLQIAIELLKL